MRLFTTIWPDAAVNDDVDARLAGLGAGWRTTARERRHVTLCFHGDADPDDLTARLAAADLAAAAGLRVRCHGAGTFGQRHGNSVLWLGVEPDDPAGLAALVAAAGGEPETHVAHLTVARSRSPGVGEVPASLSLGPGPWWPVRAVELVASGTPYRTVARVAVPQRHTGKLG